MSKIKNNLSDDVFQDFNKESCYFGGFLYGDGCVNYCRGRARVMLGITDRDVVEKFKIFTKTRANVGKYKTKGKDRYCITVTSLKMCEDLKKFNVVPRKTYSNKFDNLDTGDDNKWHYLRGIYDSDGCASSKSVMLLGTGDKFALNLINFLKTHNIKANLHKRKAGKELFLVYIVAKKDVLKFYENLYKNSDNLFCERKKDLANKLILKCKA